ncbi:MAG TPA: aliphatic sulfonate ABC transporter substrate-binding protein [Bosea sp. (in: a-proteobacteria)]|jgi:taurine transport system substrate-binding protein|nr:aliphatic sulfonate ABC transporter substrate-binding protein [Bosea sp. (in: a-proteobacteria)]
MLGSFFRIAVFSLVGISAWVAAPGFASAQAKPEVVRFGFYGGPRPWIIGKALQMFDKDMGTKIDWVQFSSGADALTALASGQVDISRMGSTATVAAIARGLSVEMIAMTGVIATSERLIAKDSIKSLPDLRGKRIAYPPGSTAHFALMAALKVAKLAANDVTLLSLKPAEMLAAWQRGDIDAAYVWGPFSHQMEGAGGRQLLATKDLQQNGYYVWNNYVVRKEFAKQYPQLVVQFLKTHEKARAMYQSDTGAMVKLIAGHLGQDESSVADTMAGLYFPSLREQLSPQFLGPGGPILDAMKFQADFLVELGDLRSREIPKNFAPGVVTTYLEQAAGQ